MKPPRFSHHVASSVDEAVELKRRYGLDGAFLAGGQSLMPMINMRLARPQGLIDLNRAADLAYVRAVDGGVEVGAMTRYRTAERDPLLARACPLVGQAIRHVAHRVVRNRGTVGGSVAHADAAAELPAALVALDARIAVRGDGGAREVAAAEFFQFHFTTTLEETEMVTAITVPETAPQTGSAFLEVSRRHGDFAIAAVAALAGPQRPARLVFAGVAPRPVVVETDDPDPAADAVAAVEAAGLTGDVVASADYRRRLVGVLARRARAEALASAGGAA